MVFVERERRMRNMNKIGEELDQRNRKSYWCGHTKIGAGAREVLGADAHILGVGAHEQKGPNPKRQNVFF